MFCQSWASLGIQWTMSVLAEVLRTHTSCVTQLKKVNKHTRCNRHCAIVGVNTCSMVMGSIRGIVCHTRSTDFLLYLPFMQNRDCIHSTKVMHHSKEEWGKHHSGTVLNTAVEHATVVTVATLPQLTGTPKELLLHTCGVLPWWCFAPVPMGCAGQA